MYRLCLATATAVLLLAGPAAAQTAPPNSVGSEQIINGSILGEDLATPLLTDTPQATTVDRISAAWAFGGQRRIAIGQQRVQLPGGREPYSSEHPGAGYVEVASTTGRTARLTHYQHGSNISTRGPKSGLFEFWLGDSQGGTPNLSVRNNGWNEGAVIEARNATDTSGVGVDFAWPDQPRVKVNDDNSVPGANLAIDNPQPDGRLSMRMKLENNTTLGGLMQEMLSITHRSGGGQVFTPGHVRFGDEKTDTVRFHGADVSGLQGADPGALPMLTAKEVATNADLARALNVQRQHQNALRSALQAHGIIG